MTRRRSTYRRPLRQQVAAVVTLAAGAVAGSSALTFVVLAAGAR